MEHYTTSPPSNERHQVELDHGRYLAERRHRRIVHAAIRRFARKARVGELLVAHDRDGGCCRREQWELTLRRLVAALGDDGVKVLSAAAAPARAATSS